MARKRKKKKGTRRYNYRSYQNKATNWVDNLNFDLELDPAVVREIIAILLVGLGLFTLLAILGGAGSVGKIFFTALRLGLGWTSFIMPILFAGSGVALFYPVRYHFKTANVIGLLLFITTLSALMHVFIGPENGLALAQEGGGGGFLGFWVSRFLLNLMDFWASFLIIVVGFAISLLFAFGQPLKDLYLRTKISLPEIPKMPDVKINSDFEIGEEAGEDDGAKKAYKAMFKSKSEKTAQETEFVPQFTPTGDWSPPSIDLLSDAVTKVDSGNINANIATIQETLEDFNIAVEMHEVNVGPTVTQYTLKPASGIKLSRIANLTNDLALALAAHPIRIEAPIPGRSLVGIEVPNKKTALVRLREVMESGEFDSIKSPLRIPLGRDVAGTPMATDLIKMPHLLIAGATGAGKSVFLNSLLIGLLYQNSPEDLRIILVDPKRVEFTTYNDVPHLLSPVIVDPHKTINSLKWLVVEMDRRYRAMSDAKVRDIASYNRQNRDGKMPYIVLVIDELADLMAVSAREVEAYICRLAQMSRAVGIHLVLATQRPSVDVITGLIKANFPSRIAFAVTSGTDSRTVLDTIGAEKLLGNGDMLFMPSDSSKPKRIQACFIDDKEVKAVSNALREMSGPQYVEEVLRDSKGSGGNMFGGSDNDEGDDLFQDAVELVAKTGKASASYLQRRFRIGYARAARLLDILEDKGIIGPSEGAKPRDVLIKKEDLPRIFGNTDVDEETGEEFREGEDY
ncbi:MAG: DNA translocase FtsK 4TM domain-containing protein [Patescibacteria group bacterium]|nr:DNA translocase FtsK 4TM domain-containing protein [Patescibacteria group bacterium]